MKKLVSLLMILVIVLISCRGKSPSPMTDNDLAKAQKDLIQENKRQHAEEMKAIKDFIATSSWPMKGTSSGLHYWIYQNGAGDAARKDQHVWIAYDIRLLDGTACYSADSLNPKHIHIGHESIETGMHEALQLMKEGDKAKFIFPSHLAFGFTGDSKKIPQNASVIYDLHLLRIEP